MNLQADDFELFGLARQFEQAKPTLDAHWKALQREAHPDKFAAQGAAAQRLAMQWSVRINEAYQRLKNPLKRAAYLCELAGHPIQAHSNTAMPAAFLMRQMEWREALEDAQQVADLNALEDEVRAYQTSLLADCARSIDQEKNYAAAVNTVRALMFIEKLESDIDTRLSTLA